MISWISGGGLQLVLQTNDDKTIQQTVSLDATELSLANLNIKSLPDSIVSLTNLKKLDLSHNKITSFPATFRLPLSLQSLDLSHNNLQSLPESFEFLVNLKMLNLSHNQLATVPDFVSSIPNLNVLDLSFNRRISLSELTISASSLQILNISHCNLTCLPNEIGSLPSLQTLDISFNKLLSVPDSFGLLKRLQELEVSNNKIRSLPDSIGSLSNLRKLMCSSNQLDVLPNSLHSLSRLQTLDLSDNAILAIPDWIGSLSKLVELNVSLNQITSVPESVRLLSALERFNISDNQITALPDSIKSLSNLQKLGLANNQLTSVPNAIHSLTNLNFMDLSYNQLTSIPDWIGELVLLQHLDISSNKITQLPNSIGFLKSIDVLNISSNNLLSLPFTLGPLMQKRVKVNIDKKLEDLLLYHPNPLTEILPEYRWLHARLIEYLSDLSKIAVNRLKVMLLGEATTGKTALLKRLTGTLSVPGYLTQYVSRATDPTVGVDIVDWEALPESLKFVFVDCGGQKQHHMIHRFHLATSKPLFLMFFDLESEFKIESASTDNRAQLTSSLDRLEYWWDFISAHAAGSPICVVGTKLDSIPEAKRRQFLERCSDRLKALLENWNRSHQNANIRDERKPLQLAVAADGLSFWPTSSFTQDGIPALVDFLKFEAQNAMASQTVPVRTLHLHRLIRDIQAKPSDPPIVKLSDLKSKHDIDWFEPVQQLKESLACLRDWGYIMWFGDVPGSGRDLSECILLDPKWLSNTVLKLLENQWTFCIYGCRLKMLDFQYRGSGMRLDDSLQHFVLGVLMKLGISTLYLKSALVLPTDNAQDSSPTILLTPALFFDDCSESTFLQKHNDASSKSNVFVCMERRFGIKFIPHAMMGKIIEGMAPHFANELGTGIVRAVSTWQTGLLINVRNCTPGNFETSVLVQFTGPTPSPQTMGISGVSSQFDPKITPHWIRLSLRMWQPKCNDQLKDNETKGHVNRQCQRMMAWLHQFLTRLTDNAYPSIMIPGSSVEIE